jgi:hypothetical protein
LICGGIFFAAVESKHSADQEGQRQAIILNTYDSIRVLADQMLNDQLNEDFDQAFQSWRWSKGNPLSQIVLDDNRTLLLDQHIDLELENLALSLTLQNSLTDRHAYKWTLSTAILYAATLITTIGYGNIAPKTAMGKICTVLCWSSTNHCTYTSNRHCFRCVDRNSIDGVMAQIFS